MQRGLTLLEVLLTAIIAVVLLGLTAQGIMRGSEITRIVTAQQELLEDVRSVGAFLADQFSQAIYVYPPGISITLGKATDYWSNKPSSSSNTWVIGTDPMVAFILPPEDSGLIAQCRSGVPNNPKGCLRFMAFYALKRENITHNPNVPLAVRPETNAKNSDTWVLYYFTCPMLEGGCGNGPRPTLPTQFSSAEVLPNKFDGPPGQFLADYINPAGWNVTLTCAVDTLDTLKVTLDSKCSKTSLPLMDKTAATVELTLQSRVTRGNYTTLVPNPPLTIKSSARNLVLP